MLRIWSNRLRRQTVCNYRLFSSAAQSVSLDVLQQNKSYQKALELAHEKKYEATIAQLEKTMEELSELLGSPYTQLHQIILYRIASVQKILKNNEGVEDIFRRSIAIAENSPVEDRGANTRLARVFHQQSNLLKFYIENNVNKAVEYG